MGRRAAPVRTCVGCRVRTAMVDLLRVVAVEGPAALAVVPDPRHRLPGRGAHLHPVPDCLAQAVRRRAFSRALRLTERSPGALDTTAVRRYVEAGTAPSTAQHTPERTSSGDDGHFDGRRTAQHESRSRTR